MIPVTPAADPTSAATLRTGDTDTHVTGDPLGESALLVALQKYGLPVPGAIPAARGLSLIGEHALGWMLIGVAAGVIDRPRRGRWFRASATAFTAHAAAVVVKRVVRRPRPHRADIQIVAKTPSSLSFPSSHATSTTAALTAFADITGCTPIRFGIPAMMAARMLLGVHYPTDVTAGWILGHVVAAAMARVRPGHRD